MEKVKFEVEDRVAETLIIPLYFRARQSDRPNPLLVDRAAVELVEKIDFDYSRIKLQKHDEAALILRVREFDRMAGEFLKRNPDATVVHIGCGLDTRFERLDNGRMQWYDLDLAEVIEMRKRLGLIEKERYHTISSSVFDFNWIEQLSQSKHKSVLFISEGVLIYFQEDLVKSLILKLRECFPNSELICDETTPLMEFLDNLHLLFTNFKARLKWGMDHPEDMETWAEGIRLIEEYYYFDRSEPSLGAMQSVRYLPALAKGTGIFHYMLGGGKKEVNQIKIKADPIMKNNPNE
jgi:O-methyltransferase involved in polyketide biosynthesis